MKKEYLSGGAWKTGVKPSTAPDIDTKIRSTLGHGLNYEFSEGKILWIDTDGLTAAEKAALKVLFETQGVV